MNPIYAITLYPLELFYKQLYLFIYGGVGNLGLALILLSLVNFILCLPLEKFAKKLQLSPQVKIIKVESQGGAKHQRLSAMFKRYCQHLIYVLRNYAWLLVQIPFLIAVFYMVSIMPQLQGQPFLVIQNLSAPDALLGGINLLPLLVTMLNLIYVYLYTRGESIKTKIFPFVLVILFLVLLYPAPSSFFIFCMITSLLNFSKFAPPVSQQSVRNHLYIYILSVLALIVMILFYLPSELYVSDAKAFGISLTNLLSGMLIYVNVIIFITTFFWMWGNLFVRRLLAYSMFSILLFAIINYFIISSDFGVIDGGFLTRAHDLLYGAKSIFRDLVTPIIVAAILLALFCLTKIRKYTVPYIMVNIISMALIASFYMARDVIQDQYQVKPYLEKMQSYSKDKENVVILILDMFTGGHIQLMIDDPWFADFKASMDGFVWYPDTLATGSATILSMPSIYGGSDYTPTKTNLKKMSLIENLNKAYSVLPRNFSKYNYDVSIINGLDNFNEEYIKKYGGMNDKVTYVPLVDYNSFPDLSLIPGIEYADVLETSFAVAVALYQVSPTFFKRMIYANNTYTRLWLHDVLTLEMKGMELARGWLKHFYYTLTSNITNTSPNGTLKIFYTQLSHHPFHLDETKLELVKDPYPASPGQWILVDNVIPEHYYTERHMMRILADYFAILKEQGIYDNTRIILVSDHTMGDSQMLGNLFPQNIKGELIGYGSDKHHVIKQFGRPHALLMVKEAGSRGPLVIDNSLMSIEDVPMLASLSLPECNEFVLQDPRRQTNQRVREHAHGYWTLTRHDKDKFHFDLHTIEGTMFNLDNWKTTKNIEDRIY